ncbi:MAG: endopeptidase La [Oscillospiraceae bacterium]|nr:endopeptidase La [Oscillospiraceae bacterium]
MSANLSLPALPMRGLVIFPKMVLHFDVGREKSVDALRAAASSGRKIFLVTYKETESEPVTADSDSVSGDEVYKIGVVAEVRQILKTPENTTRVLVEGLHKAKLLTIDSREPYMQCTVAPIRNSSSRLSESEGAALLRMLTAAFRRYCSLAPRMPNELYQTILTEKNIERLFDAIVFNIFLKAEDKQRLLEISGIKKRIECLLTVLENEIGIMELEVNIHEQVRDNMEKNQREYYLREQMRVLSRQLGDREDPQEEFYAYLEEIESIGFAEDIEEKLVAEAEKLMKYSSHSQEAGTVRDYLDTVLEMPWNSLTKEKIDIVKAQKQLDKDHYGLKEVKERIIELFAVRALKPDVRGQIICLAGPPGVGKTSVGKSIAKALGRKYARISLGGVRDEAEIRGHRKTYVGAMPGRIVNAIKQAKSMNPVILLDEIDKMSNDYKGDPSSAMLEVLDAEQNTAFVDHFLEIPIDLSRVMFITTANNTDEIPPPLLDRMEVIELSSYTGIEKFNIAKKHLIPKQLKKHGLSASKMGLSPAGIYTLIDSYTKEAGVRKLERKIASLCRKAAKEIVSREQLPEGESVPEKFDKIKFTPDNLVKYLGVKKYMPEEISKFDEVGVVNGLAWTSVGGVLMPLEVAVMDGTGKIELTGSLGDVMKESSKIAVSLVRTLCAKYNIEPDFYKTKDLHIHAPEGAVPKNGPSAGVAMVTALVSALSGGAGVAVRRDVAMTGEITLHGKVLAIGGLKEKAMAAYKSGIKTVLIPKENEPDISELDESVRDNLRFIAVEKIDTVLEVALVERIEGVQLIDKMNLKRAAENVVDGLSVENVDLVGSKRKRVRRT